MAPAIHLTPKQREFLETAKTGDGVIYHILPLTRAFYWLTGDTTLRDASGKALRTAGLIESDNPAGPSWNRRYKIAGEKAWWDELV